MSRAPGIPRTPRTPRTCCRPITYYSHHDNQLERLGKSYPLTAIYDPVEIVKLYLPTDREYPWEDLARDNDILSHLLLCTIVPDVTLKNMSGYQISRDAPASDMLSCVDAIQGRWDLLRQIPVLQDHLGRMSVEQLDNFRELYFLYSLALSKEAPFEFAKTSQYNQAEPQMSVKARHAIRAREKIAHLVAIVSPLTREDVWRLESSGNDFSLIETYSNGTHLLLGPVQYVNSDCRPNARLTWDSFLRVTVEALRHIHPGEEICISYGQRYFDPIKNPCRCKTCHGENILKIE